MREGRNSRTRADERPRRSSCQRAARAARDRVRRLHRLLAKEYGDRAWPERPPSNGRSGTAGRPPRALDQLIATVLSQNTNDRNSGEGFRRLKRRFRSWKKVAEAPVADVAEAIHVSGLANIKARRIQHILRKVKADNGRYTLQSLGKLSAGEAKEYLNSFKGVGPKTVACVLLFSFDMPVFPVDTHILRVSKRLGLVPPRTTAEQAHEEWQRMIPEELVYPLHLLIIEHGRLTCHARGPECPRCVIRQDCPSAKKGSFYFSRHQNPLLVCKKADSGQQKK